MPASARVPMAYGQSTAPIRSSRGLEYDLLARSCLNLRHGWQNRAADFPALATAVAENSRIWSTLAADVVSPGNALPATLRARLFYLYEFIEQHSAKVLADMAEIAVLVDINTAVMRGLRGDPGLPT